MAPLQGVHHHHERERGGAEGSEHYSSLTDPRRDPSSPFALACNQRYPTDMASTLDKDKLHEVLDEAVIVIDAADLERSRSDPRVAAFHDSAESLLLELEAEGAEYS